MRFTIGTTQLAVTCFSPSRSESKSTVATVNATAYCRDCETRNTNAGVVRVGSINMGVHADGEFGLSRMERKSGGAEGVGDGYRRRMQRCKRCLDSGDEARVMNAQECIGRQNQDRCSFVT
jgi:hypothetical protein